MSVELSAVLPFCFSRGSCPGRRLAPPGRNAWRSDLFRANRRIAPRPRSRGGRIPALPRGRVRRRRDAKETRCLRRHRRAAATRGRDLRIAARGPRPRRRRARPRGRSASRPRRRRVAGSLERPLRRSWRAFILERFACVVGGARGGNFGARRGPVRLVGAWGVRRRTRGAEDGAHSGLGRKKFSRPGFRPGSLPFAPVGLRRPKEKRFVYPKCFSPKLRPKAATRSGRPAGTHPRTKTTKYISNG